MSRSLKIATRESPLALWQAEHIRNQILHFHPQLKVELLGMTTRADQWLETPLNKIGGKGLFVKELEESMLRGEADMAVHSMKDVPMELPEGLVLHTICEREDPTDAFVSNNYSSLDALPEGAVLGTSSLRRQCQIMLLRPDLQVKSLRGNVNTRLRKLDEGEFDAIILASAGLKRLGFSERIRESLQPSQCMPAGGQGAVGIEIRSDDTELMEILAPLNHRETNHCVRAERRMNQKLNGGCQVPIAAFATLHTSANGGERLHLDALVGDAKGEKILRGSAQAQIDTALGWQTAEQVGIEVADQLLEQGAADILSAIYAQST